MRTVLWVALAILLGGCHAFWEDEEDAAGNLPEGIENQEELESRLLEGLEIQDASRVKGPAPASSQAANAPRITELSSPRLWTVGKPQSVTLKTNNSERDDITDLFISLGQAESVLRLPLSLTSQSLSISLTLSKDKADLFAGRRFALALALGKQDGLVGPAVPLSISVAARATPENGSCPNRADAVCFAYALPGASGRKCGENNKLYQCDATIPETPDCAPSECQCYLLANCSDACTDDHRGQASCTASTEDGDAEKAEGENE